MRIVDVPILLVAAVCVSTAADARTCLVLPPEPRDLNQFMERVVLSLELLKDGRTKTAGSPMKNWTAGSAKDFFVRLKQAQQDFECAAKFMEGYDKNPNQSVQNAADGIRTVAMQLSELNDLVRTVMVAAMNGQQIVEKRGDWADEMAKLETLINDTSESLVTAGTVAGMSLIEFDPTGKLRRQALTSAQRAAICKTLAKSFPQVTKRGQNLPALEGAAAIIYDFLSNKKWKSHDQAF